MSGIRKDSSREINISGSENLLNSIYPRNNLNFSRYNWFTFIPKNLFEQFQRSSNIWFLIISVFQIVYPELNPTTSYTTIFPLIFLILISLLQDFYNEITLHKKISLINDAEYQYWCGDDFVGKMCKEIMVGDIIKVNSGQIIPADMILIAVQSELVSVTTDMKGISGSTKIKQTSVIEKHHKLLEIEEDCISINARFTGILKISEPTPDYSSFFGKLVIGGHPGSIKLKIDNILFKGSYTQENVDIIGIAAYCGPESKIQLNLLKSRRKITRIEQKLNKLVFYILFILCILLIISIIGYYLSEGYIFSSYSGTTNYPTQPIIIFILLYNNIIPISLFMILDICRAFQGYLISRKIPGISFLIGKANENLGQVEYILADKAAITSESQPSVNVLIIKDELFYRNTTVESIGNSTLYDYSEKENSPRIIISKQEMVEDKQSFKALTALLSRDSESRNAIKFLTAITLCNTLKHSEDKMIGSLDEIALLEASKSLGFNLTSTGSNKLVLEYRETIKRFEVIISRPFNSKSKRSRILVYNLDERYGMLYVKGEYCHMKKLLKLDEEADNKITANVEAMNNKGYRTMIIAEKKIKFKNISKIKDKALKASQCLIYPDFKQESIIRHLEKKLTYLGITCIIEEIQEKNIRAISDIKKSGIKLWMVSGDSYNNTLLTAKVSELFNIDAPILHLKEITDEYTLIKTMKKFISKHIFFDYRSSRISESPDIFQEVNITEIELDESNILPKSSILDPLSSNTLLKKITNIEMELIGFDSKFDIKKLNYFIAIDRITFQVAINIESCRKLLILLLICAKSACFSLMMPIDKGNLAIMLKKNVAFKPLVLGIGSGEGDLLLLQSSDIGIYLENSQNSLICSNLCDIKMLNFFDIKDLILKQGHRIYFKISKAILLFLYKNFFLAFVLCGYIFHSKYSGTSLFNGSLLVGYNLVFTTLPIIFIALFDKDTPSSELERCPKIYTSGIRDLYFNVKIVLFYTFTAFFHAAIMMIIVFLCKPEIFFNNGKSEDLEYLGTIIYVELILTVLLYIYLDTYTYSIAYHFSHILCGAFLFLFITFESNVDVPDNSLVGVNSKIIYSPYGFLTIFLIPIFCILPTYIFSKYFQLFSDDPLNGIKKLPDATTFFSKIQNYSSSFISLYRHSSIWNNPSNEEKFSMKAITLQFKYKYIEKEFKEVFITENILVIKITFIVIWILIIIWTIFQATILENSWAIIIVNILISAFSSIFIYLLFIDHFKKYYKSYIIIVLIVGLITKFSLELAFNYSSIVAASIFPSLSYILLNVSWFSMNFVNALNIILMIISLSVAYSNKRLENDFIILDFLSFLIAITLTSAIVGYYLELSKRNEYKVLNSANSGVERNQNILSLLLPAFVISRVKRGVRYIAEDQGEVTVLFCDICNFEMICHEYKPKELSDFLDSLFQIFDDLCEKTGVTKIETVGKTYMVCAGLKDSDQEFNMSLTSIHHTRRIIELALAIIQEVKNIRLANGKRLNVKIGVNTGTVVAGVVGFHKPQFSLVGDTVNTASRMCSTLTEYNNVQISASTYEYAQNYKEYSFKETTVEAKGKGILKAYLVSETEFVNDIEKSLKRPSTIAYGRESLKRREYARNSTKDKLEFNLTRNTVPMNKVHSFFSMICNKYENDQEFRKKTLESNQRLIYLSLSIALCLYTALFILAMVERYKLSNFVFDNVIYGKASVIFYLLILLKFHSRIFQHKLYPIIIIIALLIILLTALFYLSFQNSVPINFLSDHLALEFMYVIILLTFASVAYFRVILIMNICVFVPWSVLLFKSSINNQGVSNFVIVAGFSIINIAAWLIQNKINRKTYELQILAENEIKETEQLLTQMVPPHVLSNLENDQAITDRLENVSILFADVVGFTNWSSTKTPEEVIKMLSKLFTRFDKKCLKYNVYKVHTIGDCYVVIGYHEQYNRNPEIEVLNVVKMAKSMITIIKKNNLKYKSNLQMRIGIHTGEVIGGVIGRTIVRYDIWGPDVLIANKMESTGNSGRIHVSEKTKDMIEKTDQETFKFTYSKEIEVASLNCTIDGYFLDVNDE